MRDPLGPLLDVDHLMKDGEVPERPLGRPLWIYANHEPLTIPITSAVARAAFDVRVINERFW